VDVSECALAKLADLDLLHSIEQVLYGLEPGSAAYGDLRALLEMMMPLPHKLHIPPTISRTQR
jgi:hypothetical protein